MYKAGSTVLLCRLGRFFVLLTCTYTHDMNIDGGSHTIVEKHIDNCVILFVARTKKGKKMVGSIEEGIVVDGTVVLSQPP